HRRRRPSATRASRPHARIFLRRLDATRGADRDRRRRGAHATDVGEGARQRLHAGAAPNSWLIAFNLLGNSWGEVWARPFAPFIAWQFFVSSPLSRSVASFHLF